MFYQLKLSFRVLTYQVNDYVRNQLFDLEPQGYCVGAVFVIAIGFVLLSGRR